MTPEEQATIARQQALGNLVRQQSQGGQQLPPPQAQPGQPANGDNEAIQRAIDAIKNGTVPMQGQGQPSPAPQPPVNDPNLNANQPGQPQPSTPPPASNPEQTMQQNPQNLVDALKQKSRQQQLDDLMNAAKQ